MIRKTLDHVWGLNLSIYACQKNFKPYRRRGYTCFTEVYVPFHRTMTIHIGYQGFCGSYAFRCRIGLKIILRLARAMCEGNTKFGIFQRWFATFSGLIEFPRDDTV